VRLATDTWLLLTLRWQTTWNTFRSGRVVGRILSLLLVLLLLAGGALGTGVVGRVTGLLLRRGTVAGLEPGLEGLFPGLVLSLIIFVLLLSSFGVALGSLFLASDLDLLMAAPVDRRAVFVSKILDGMGWYYALVAALALPTLFAYGVALRFDPAYYVLTLFTVLVTPLLPAALGAVLVLLVARFAPARRVREVLGLVAALVGVSCSLVGQTSRVWGSRLRDAGVSPQTVLAELRELALLPVPSVVAGRGLAAAGMGDLGAAVRDIAGFVLLTLGVFVGCVLLADRMYTTGWVRMQSSGSARRSRARAAREAARAGWLGRAPAVLAIALKDWRVIPRDLRNFAQLLSPLIILPAVYLNILSGSGRRASPLESVGGLAGVLTGEAGRAAGQGPAVSLDGVFVAIGVLTASVLVFGRIATTSVSREGQTWWLLKAAPVTGTELLAGKLLAAAVPYVLLSSALLAGAAVWLGFGVGGTLYGWLGVELIGTGMLALSVGLGVPWARLDWDDPRRMSSGWGALVTALSSFLFALLAGALLCLPLLVGVLAPDLAPAAWVFCPGVVVVLTTGTVALSLQFGTARLATVGET
jgi:ABC-2 type transport system permease protein